MAEYRRAELLIRFKDCMFDVQGMRWKYTYPPQVIELLARLLRDHAMGELETFWPIGVRPIDIPEESIFAPPPERWRALLSMVSRRRPRNRWQSPRFTPNDTMVRKARLRLIARFHSDSSLDAAMHLLRQEPLVAYAERIPVRTGPQAPKPEPAPPVGKGKNDDLDTLAASTWWRTALKVPVEWNDAKISNIAVVDCGCDLTHPALSSRILSDPSGHDEVWEHGTRICTQLIGSDSGASFTTENIEEEIPKGYSALPQSTLRSFAVTDSNSTAVWAVDSGLYDYVLHLLADSNMHPCHPDLRLVEDPVKVVNLSIGNSYLTSASEREAFQALINGSVLPVACVHNIGTHDTDYSVWYPAALPTVVSVGAVSKSGGITAFSRFGLPQTENQQFLRKCHSVDLCAPGLNVYSLLPQKSGQVLASRNVGTSFAAPFVTAAASVLWAANPTASVAEVRDILFSAVHWYNSSAGDHANRHKYGRGILNCESILPPI